MKLKYLIICGHNKQEVEIESNLVLMEWVTRMVERFGPVDLIYRM